MENQLTAENFIIELEQLCKKYDMVITHEDGQGAFQIMELTTHRLNKLKDAEIYT